MKKLISVTLILVSILSIGMALVGCTEEKEYTVKFLNDKTVYHTEVVKGNEMVKKPNDPTKLKNTFLGWFLNGKEWIFETMKVKKNISLNASWQTEAATGYLTEIFHQDETITLGEYALYVNEKIPFISLGKYAFNSLQDLVIAAKSGTNQKQVMIYLEPNVYWTDDRNSDNAENQLIGLVIPQEYITLVGMGESREDVVIAGNRGQMAGAKGNWSVLGVSNGFQAKNLTIGNFCNIDLIYNLDRSQDVLKRQETITQAQVLTTSSAIPMDKWIIDNCKIVSYLNLLAAGSNLNRVFIKNSYLQCTDDALTIGKSVVYENCDIKLFANHPTWSPSNDLHAFLNCRFETALIDPLANPTVYLSKALGSFSIVDSSFNGNATSVEWENVLNSEIRGYVSNNTINGVSLIISPLRPELSVILNEKALKAYKVNDVYNTYNLLRGTDDWDPNNVKDKVIGYENEVYKIVLSTNTKNLAKGETAIITYKVFPTRLQDQLVITWTTDNPIGLITANEDGTISLSGTNPNPHDVYVNLFAKIEDYNITSSIGINFELDSQPAPTISNLTVHAPNDGVVEVSYSIGLQTFNDHSFIKWYRSANKQ